MMKIKLLFISLLVLTTVFLNAAEKKDEPRLMAYKGINVAAKLNNENDTFGQFKINAGFMYEMVNNTNLFFSYCISALWDGQENSSPFKDINHNPEFFWVTSLDFIPFLKGIKPEIKVGYEHISNGVDDESSDYEGLTNRSRSVHNINVHPAVHFGEGIIFKLSPKFWINTVDRENTDIGDYYGNADLRMSLDIYDKVTLTVNLRGNPATGKGRIENQMTLPMSWPATWIFGSKPNTYWFFEYFEGYGETLLHYNIYNRSFRIGLALARS